MVHFQNPEWFAVLPVLALVGWYWRRLELWKPLRAVLLVLLVVILTRPQMRLLQEGMDLHVLLDRSASTEGKIDQGLPEWRKLLEEGRRSRHDRVVLVNYAADVQPEETLAGQPFSGNRNLTRTALAVQTALALRNPERPARLLAFTDGFSTESLAGIAERLQRENVPLDIRLLAEERGDDFRISRLQLPARTQVSEPFLLEVEVTGPRDGTLPLIVSRNGQKLADSEVVLKNGRGVARFSDRLTKTGAFKYEAAIRPSGDPHLGNDRFEAWTEIAGGPRLLLVTGYTSDPVAAVLQQQGFAVETVRDAAALQVGQLAGCRGVIFNNVPAAVVPRDFLASLDFFVRQQGGGFLMAGGRQSFGSGGYFHSAVDEILPVSMELKLDQRKTAVSMAIVMDRSGSMGMTVAGGMKKMDLANEGAAKAIEMLGYLDSVAVIAVDSAPHEAVGMQPVGDEANKQTLMKLCRRITVGGGGIFTYTGLAAGWKALRATSVGTRHLILFADAADAEEPGDYVNLLAEMEKEGATVSVIALGTKADADAKFLEDVAARGKGRIFFTNQASELPGIFTQETVAVARAAFIKEPVPTAATGGWVEISGKDLSWLGEVDGFNLSYKKDWASQALVTQDEYAAPLVAWGQRGLGRAAAVSFPLGGEFSERIRNWPRYGDFLQTLARWLMGEDLPPGLGLKQEIAGTELKLDLLFDESWEEKFAAHAPRIVLAEGATGETQRELTWRRLAPGHYSVSTELAAGEMVRGVIQADRQVLPFGPVVVGASAEWAFDPARVEELRQTALLSGGRELLDLKDAWLAPPAQEFADIRHWLLLAALALLLAEALVTRMGWRLPEFGRRLRRNRVPISAAAAAGRNQPSTAMVAEPRTDASPVVPPHRQDDGAAQRRSRFARAKRRE
ncbi:MAG: VWA domain-containing protein [Verrucomicrobiales bacterium]|nr:VWA domain-containing protein [Verrucomicrobiales bacterium]